jgi:hypothetical protein
LQIPIPLADVIAMGVVVAGFEVIEVNDDERGFSECVGP